MSDIVALEARIFVLEQRMDRFDTSLSMIEKSVDTFGDYKRRTNEELDFIDQQLVIMMNSLESVLANNVYQTDITRAKSLKSRLKNHQTRVRNAKSKAS